MNDDLNDGGITLHFDRDEHVLEITCDGGICYYPGVIQSADDTPDEPTIIEQ